MALLHSLGARSVPVVSKGEKFVFAQSIGDVADFLEIDVDTSPQLSPEELIAKLDMILLAAQRFIRQIPDDRLGENIKDRPRTLRELGYHNSRIVEALVEVGQGAELTYSDYQDNPPADMQTGEQIAAYGEGVRQSLHAWWNELDDKECRFEVETYFGTKPMHEVMERSTWHPGQHLRQIMMVLEGMDVAPDQPLTAADFSGLPMPEKVWDD